MITPICIIFVGSSPPSDEWLRNKAKPLAVHREKVRDALEWLQKHNTFYKNVFIDHCRIDQLAESQILPVHVEHVLPNESAEVLTSRYDSTMPSHNTDQSSTEPEYSEISFQNVVITDIDGNAPSNQL